MENSVKIGRQANFIVLLGPLLVVFALMISAHRSLSTSWDILMSGVLGLVACLLWDWRGLIGAVSIIVFLLAYHFFYSEHFTWNIALSLSFIAAFAVSIISLEQSNTSWNSLQKDAEEQKAVLQSIQERQAQFQVEQLTLHTQAEQLKEELVLSQEKLNSAEKLVELARGELAAMHTQREKLLSELYEARQSEIELENRLHALPQQKAVASDENIGMELRQIISIRDREIEDLKMRLEMVSREERLARQHIERYIADLVTVREARQNSESQLAYMQEELLKEQSQSEKSFEAIDTLRREKKLLESTLSLLQGELEAVVASGKQHAEKIGTLEVQLAEHKAACQVYAEKHHAQQLQNESLLSQLNISRKACHDAEMKAVECISQWHADKEALKTKINELDQESQMLSQQLVVNKASEEQLKQERDELLRQYQSVQKAVQETDDRELRRLQGLYNQLREQFSEKSAILDATRRELFCTQEKLAAIQKDFDEYTLYNGESMRLFRLLASAERQLATMEAGYEEQLDHLHAFINTLMTEKK